MLTVNSAVTGCLHQAKRSLTTDGSWNSKAHRRKLWAHSCTTDELWKTVMQHIHELFEDSKLDFAHLLQPLHAFQRLSADLSI